MSAAWFWCLVLLQTQVVVVFCTMPDLLLRQVSLLMASSRVMTLVVTLLVVITGGIYLLKLNVLTDVLILASAVLLARLDLIPHRCSARRRDLPASDEFGRDRWHRRRHASAPVSYTHLTLPTNDQV